MKVTGITAEFDPLHNGHAYVMKEARRSTDCDALVVAMSGDYVQRGEPAVIDKWARTKAALSSGADLVIEIPALFCLADASRYAAASVCLLEGCGCGTIAFGSESGDAGSIKDTADFIGVHLSEMEEGIRSLVSEGLSWPAARARVYRELSGKDIPDSPNDILGLEYVMNMKRAEPLAVKRADHKSASEIRKHLSETKGDTQSAHSGIDDSMPCVSADIIRDSLLTFPEDWTKILRYAVMSSDAEQLEDCPSAGEGLANLLAKAAAKEESFEKIISSVKSRRYTYTRISRLCMQAVLGITRKKYPFDAPGYIRVLGFSEKGRELLSELKNSACCSLPVITNVNKETSDLDDAAARMLALDIYAADIYNLVTGRDTGKCSDHVMRPVMI